jgi:hypothetical protein
MHPSSNYTYYVLGASNRHHCSFITINSIRGAVSHLPVCNWRHPWLFTPLSLKIDCLRFTSSLLLLNMAQYLTHLKPAERKEMSGTKSNLSLLVAYTDLQMLIAGAAKCLLKKKCNTKILTRHTAVILVQKCIMCFRYTNSNAVCWKSVVVDCFTLLWGMTDWTVRKDVCLYYGVLLACLNSRFHCKTTPLLLLF